jgi:hypothetical protein
MAGEIIEVDYKNHTKNGKVAYLYTIKTYGEYSLSSTNS